MKQTRLRNVPLKKKTGIGLEGSKLARKPRKVAETIKGTTKAKKNVGRAKKPKLNVSAFLREYGLPKSMTGKHHLRYRSPLEKGIAWYWFARFVRARDMKKYGYCVSCLQPKTFEQLQAGHFNPASSCGPSLLMDETNVQGECEGCNGFNLMHLLGYAEELDRRYGEGTSRALREKRPLQKDYNKTHYAEKATYYRAEYEKLSTTPAQIEENTTTPTV